MAMAMAVAVAVAYLKKQIDALLAVVLEDVGVGEGADGGGAAVVRPTDESVHRSSVAADATDDDHDAAGRTTPADDRMTLSL